MTKYLSCAETAKLVRATLAEAFPGVKFSVRSKVYSGGASIDVRWIDGPPSKMVEAVAGKFEGSYFDGMIDYKGSIYHMIDGQQVSMGADFIFFNRDSSDAAVARAIAMVVTKYGDALGVVPTVEAYRRGELMSIRPACLGGYEDVQQAIYRRLVKFSDRAMPAPSKTAASVFVTHDDGYSRQQGCGMSAVAVTP